MAVTITRSFVQQYQGNVLHAYQQQGSRLRQTCYFEPLTGETHNFELLDDVDAVWKTTDTLAYGPYDRHKDTPVLDAPHGRRKVSPTDAEWGDLVDREDKLRLIISPESEYARAAKNALGRATDDLIILAHFSDATDHAGAAVAYPVTGNVSDAAGATVDGTADVPALGLTFGKINRGMALHNESEVDEDSERWAITSARGIEHMLTQEKLTSADYTAMKGVQAGGIANVMGYNWIRSERGAGGAKGAVHPDGADIADCTLVHSRSIGLAVNEDMFARIAERPDKSFAHQVYCRMTKGATRIFEAGVVRIKFDKTAIPS